MKAATTSSKGGTLKNIHLVPWSRPPRPFVKWAGGKGQLLQQLEQYFPESFQSYYEPFLGGGAVFFYVVQKRSRLSAILSDINGELITAYRVVKNNVEELVCQLKKHKEDYRENPKEYYYVVREQEPSDEVGKAARLIFLNRTCYNGLYRVNKRGKFNVPFGKYKNPTVCDEENLITVSKVLRWSNAKLVATDYKKATIEAGEGDFVYFDPPYQPISLTANFTSYTHEGFSTEDQERLGDWFRELDKRGCWLLLSNSNTKEIRKIYNKYRIHEVKALRAISCIGDRRKGHTELIISNHAGKRH